MMPAGCTEYALDVAAGGYEPKPKPERFDRWQYLVIMLPMLGVIQSKIDLDQRGDQGWELVCVESGIAYLKRWRSSAT